MTYATLGRSALDYFPCRYGTSKLVFRGPRRRLEGDFATFLGGIETYGKFTAAPYPALVEQQTGLRSVNLGCVNAGVDAYLSDPNLIDICARARVTVIQLMGAQNMSNRLYSVHPRRNDRFLAASPLLHRLYPEVDFTEFHFTRHLLNALVQACPQKFASVRKELKDTWMARMHTLIERIGTRVVLLWLADHDPSGDGPCGLCATDPLFIDRQMIEALRPEVDAVVETVARPAEIAQGQGELLFATLERPAAQGMLGPVVHDRAARDLAPVLTSALH